MKKIYLILLFLIICGCGKSNDKLYEKYDDEYYKIYTPYKERVGSYSLKTVNSINLEEAELVLMDLSKEYFDIDKLYYQEGQYLDNEFLKELLVSVNDFEEIKVSNNIIKPNYITAILEQNYLNEEGNLNGISLGILLNPYQSYTNTYGATVYKNVLEEKVIAYAKDKIESILSSIRKKYDLNDIKIMVGLFIQSKPDNYLPGTYREYGITNDNNVNFKDVDYEYHDLDNISDIDSDNYEVYLDLKEKLSSLVSNIYISSYGLYKNNSMHKMIINITYNSTNRSTVLYLNQVLSKEIIPNFGSNINIKVYIKNNNDITSILFKEKNSVQSTIYLVD